MKIDWLQIGEDFQQKYEQTFCRYTSPLSGKQEVFHVQRVSPRDNEAPAITIYNKKHGDVLLKYTTDAELDFTFPSCGYFAHQGKALLFNRLYTRQWKKGMCNQTAGVLLPYPYPYGSPGLSEDTIASSFKPRKDQSFTEAAQQMRDAAMFSTPVSATFALGRGQKDELWVWYETEIIGELVGNKLTVHAPHFKQEVMDHVRNTGDYATQVV